MEGRKLFKSIALKNLLSYGDKGVELELEPLNVIIGPNGSGKSNLIEAFRLIHATPQDLSQPIGQGGGIAEWLWKGAPENYQRIADIQVISYYQSELSYDVTLKHSIALWAFDPPFSVFSEEIAFVGPNIEVQPLFLNMSRSYTIYRQQSERELSREYAPLKLDKINIRQSILSQRSDPDLYPGLAKLVRNYSHISFIADINLSKLSPVRRPQDASLDQNFLFEDASNLALVLNDLQNKPDAMRTIIDKLKLFNPQIENIITRVNGGTVQVFLQERGLKQTVPATRLSDGTLRFLCLLTVLCHPDPPPLICIEEPELGMHPDIIPTIAELLIEASRRTQLIVTTHSELLVLALSHIPEAVIVCEREEEGSTLRRLEPDRLTLWLEKYSLGELWLKGELGGTRW